jgi:lipoprotein-anchoring transpeptidase ErfK/SrfK
VPLATRRRPRRGLTTIAGAAATCLAIGALTGASPSAAPAPKSADAARGAKEASPAESAYTRARASGQPVALLTRPTVLRGTPAGRPLARLATRTEFDSPRVLAAVGESRDGSWLRVVSSELPNGERGWIPASAADIVPSEWRVQADLSARRVTVLRHGRPVRSFTVDVGRPGTPTPTGSFAVTDKIRFKGGHAAYGCCALALSGHQPHIEPGWTGGDRLAIHGRNGQTVFGGAASFGCLRASERDVRFLIARVKLGTIVKIRP